MDSTGLDVLIDELTVSLGKSGMSFSLERIRAALEFARVAHADEKRLSGEPMVRHPLRTAIILSSWRMDEDTIVAGLLHDTVEHGAATEKDIKDNFGEDVLNLVKSVTNVSRLKLTGSSDEVFVENLRKMFLAIAKDLRVVFLRLAERIDNLRTLEFLPEGRRQAYAKDSLEIYGILAERLGMWEAKKEIDNNAFQFAYPEEFLKVKNISLAVYRDSGSVITEATNALSKALNRSLINAGIFSRKKDLYSLFTKLKRPEINWNIDAVHDIVAMRIIVKTIPECYQVLGIVHEIFKPVPHLEVGDFIARPKPHGYRSIHTRVIGPKGRILEIQIRTEDMHREAELGAAAHWQMNILKRSGKLTSQSIDKGEWVVPKSLMWVKELSKWQSEIKDSKEFLRAVKFDALAKRIFALSPIGDVYDLPINSTPVDFAYHVHTDLGKYIVGAKADGKVVPLNYIIQNGQVIEIIKSKNAKAPTADWLDFTVSTVARREIKKHLRKNRQEDILN